MQVKFKFQFHLQMWKYRNHRCHYVPLFIHKYIFFMCRTVLDFMGVLFVLLEYLYNIIFSI